MILLAICLVVFCLIAILVGRYVLVKNLNIHAVDFQFYEEFSKIFVEFVESKQRGEPNLEKLAWLISNSDKMQNLLGSIGIINYLDAYSGRVFNYYPVIINDVPKLNDDYIYISATRSVHQLLLRHRGITLEKINHARNQANNLVKCFSEGIAHIFAIPLYVLSTFKLISVSTIDWIISTKTYRLISWVFLLFVGTISFTSDFLTVIGFEPIKTYLSKQFINKQDTVKIQRRISPKTSPRSVTTVPESTTSQPFSRSAGTHDAMGKKSSKNHL